MTYDEIMAQANNSGMTPEELQRRDELIRRVMQHTPELAAQMARIFICWVGVNPAR